MILRLIALFKLLKGLLLLAAGLMALRLLHEDVGLVVAGWMDRLGLEAQNRYIDALLTRLSALDARTLRSVGAGAFFYAALVLTEGVGLWRRRRWAEYFTIVVTGSFIPLEVYELTKRFTTARFGVIVLNLAIVLYLVRRVRGAARRDSVRPAAASS